MVVDFPAAAQAARLVLGSQPRTTGHIDDSGVAPGGDIFIATLSPVWKPATTLG